MDCDLAGRRYETIVESCSSSRDRCRSSACTSTWRCRPRVDDRPDEEGGISTNLLAPDQLAVLDGAIPG
jgi:hypothetical protein